jgi:hypothetical protein
MEYKNMRKSSIAVLTLAILVCAIPARAQPMRDYGYGMGDERRETHECMHRNLESNGLERTMHFQMEKWLAENPGANRIARNEEWRAIRESHPEVRWAFEACRSR